MNLLHTKPDYTDEEGPVVYLDGSALNRPIEMPRQARLIMLALIVCAIIIGVKIGSDVIGTVVGNNAASKASLEQNLTKQVSYNIPAMSTLVNADNETILATFESEGLTIYNQTAEGDSGLDVVKLPPDVTLAEAATMYAKGVSSLSAANAARLLNGSWTLSIDRSDSSQSIAIKYADFTASSIEAAISSAIVQAGFDASTTPQDGTGTDDMGNTYQTGTIDIDGSTYNWRVSATALSNKYNISGLPESAVFVGIRLNA